MELVWYLIVGGLIGWLAGLILSKNIPGGVIGNTLAGTIGSWIGGTIFGSWGPELAGIYLIPALIGSILLIFLLSSIIKVTRSKR